MRHAYRIAFSVLLATGSMLAVAPLTTSAENAADLDRQASHVDAAVNGQASAQVGGRIADQLNAQWAPNSPAYSAESVGQQRGPDKFGGWGGVLIGNLIAVNIAKSTLAAPNNTLTPEQALALATQQVLDARQGQDKRGWGRLAQDLTGQKLGALVRSAQPAAVAVAGQSLSTGKSTKGAGQPPGKATDQASSKTFDSSAAHSASVTVSGPGVTGRGQDKDVAGKDVADRDGGHGGAGGHGGGGQGGGNGGGNGGGGGGKGK
jgi:hypothetical protein